MSKEKEEFLAEAKKNGYKVLSFKRTENDEDEELLGRDVIEKGVAKIKKGKKEETVRWEWRHTEYNYELIVQVGYGNREIDECSFPHASEIFFHV